MYFRGGAGGRDMQGVFLGLAANRPLSVQPLGLFDERLKLLSKDHQARTVAPAPALPKQAGTKM